jgi:hypothetical protein
VLVVWAERKTRCANLLWPRLLPGHFHLVDLHDSSRARKRISNSEKWPFCDSCAMSKLQIIRRQTQNLWAYNYRRRTVQSYLSFREIRGTKYRYQTCGIKIDMYTPTAMDILAIIDGDASCSIVSDDASIHSNVGQYRHW